MSEPCLDTVEVCGSRPAIWPSPHPEELDLLPELETVRLGSHDARPPTGACSPMVERLAAEVEIRRLVVLGGRDCPDNELLAREVAWYMTVMRSHRARQVSARRWLAGLAPLRLESLARLPAGTLLLLDRVRPYHLGHSLRPLLEALTRHDQHAIVTTDTILHQWGPDRALIESGMWKELPARELFPPEHLAEILIRSLEETRHLLRDEVVPRPLKPETRWLTGLTLEQVARRLERPSQVRALAQALVTEPAATTAPSGCPVGRGTALGPDRLEELIQRHSEERRAAACWLERLDRRHQLLVLGMLLLNGLELDQALAGLEIIVDEAWRSRDPGLEQFDHHELQPLRTFFLGIPTADDRAHPSGDGPGSATSITETTGTRLECVSPAARQALLDACRRLHRRRLLATLPVLVRMVRKASRRLRDLGRLEADPAAPLHLERAWLDLTGTTHRAQRLHLAVAETLSLLGLSSIELVEPTLLELATDQEPATRAVAALTVARWREIDPEGPHGRRLPRLLAAWLAQDTGSNGLGTTAALVLAFASRADPPNHMAHGLLVHLERLLDDHQPATRRCLRDQVLPAILAGHLLQLEPLLTARALAHDDLLRPIARGVALALELRPHEARGLITRWHRETSAPPQPAGDRPPGPERSAMRAVLACVYGRTRDDGHRLGLTMRQILDRLEETRARDRHRRVLEAVLEALVELGRSRHEQVAPALYRVLAGLAADEHDLAVLCLARTVGSDRATRSEPHPVATFECPMTATPSTIATLAAAETTETTSRLLVSWLDGAAAPTVRRIALRALAASVWPEARPGGQQPRPRRRRRARRHRCGIALAVRLAAPTSAAARELIAVLLPELLATAAQTSAASLGSLLEQLRSSGVNPHTLRLLERAALLYRFRWLAMPVAAPLIVALLILARLL